MKPILHPPSESQEAKLFRRGTGRRTRLTAAARDEWVRRVVDSRGVEYGVNRAGMVVRLQPRPYYGKSGRRLHIALRRASKAINPTPTLYIEEAK
jgi:hypothetical protein